MDHKDIYILGLCCYSHESTVSLIKNGEILFVLEEERISREKHTWKFPIYSLAACLNQFNLTLDDISFVTFFIKPFKEITGNALHMLRYFPKSLNLLKAEYGGGAGLSAMERINLCRHISETLKQTFKAKRKPKVHFIEHHLAHASSCFHLSSFDKASILTIDGRGESTTTLLAKGDGLEIEKLLEVPVPHSLGHLYAAITDYLGFNAFYDEWKIMGMSAYGNDEYIAAFDEIVILSKEKLFQLDLSYFNFHTHGNKNWMSEKFINRFGPKRQPEAELNQHHYDIAKALQKVVEKAGVHLANELYRLNPETKNLCMAGGVALNILMNRKIIDQTPFENIFIQPMANDAGTAMGSSLYHWHSVLKQPRREPFESAYLGPEYSNDEIEQELKNRNLNYSKEESITKKVAKLISDQKIVGWFQGRMEAGPRALGNRSILADARSTDMKDRLNLRVKNREFFRPFAPSVLKEHAHQYFDLPENIDSPYMILSAMVKEDKRTTIPAVTHHDLTARPHTVSKKVNPKYWDLINEFYELTGVPVVINTSFNENEPIVCNPGEAIECFLRTEMDCIAIGDFLVSK